MTTSSRIPILASASPAPGNDVDDVFSSYLYEGSNGAGGYPNVIDNGINLLSEGGLVILKDRSAPSSWCWSDTARGVNKQLTSHNDTGETTFTDRLTAFSNVGFTVGTNSDVNNAGNQYVSYTLRRAPKFFDVVTYTGNSSSFQDITHNLGVAPALVIIKRTDASGDWGVYSAVGGSSSADCSLKFNSTEAELSPIAFSSASTFIRVYSTNFKIDANIQNATYVAYLFASNNGDGNFGPTEDQDIIKCGSYTGTGNSGQYIDVGFEPQWLMVKRSIGGSGDWMVYDTMRAFAAAYDSVSYSDSISPNSSQGDAQGVTIYPTPISSAPGGSPSKGFYLYGSNTNHNAAGSTYIYVAIRKGPLSAPSSASSVFDVSYRNEYPGSTSPGVVGDQPGFDTSFSVDFAIKTSVSPGASSPRDAGSRATGNNRILKTNSNSAAAGATGFEFDYSRGYGATATTDSNIYSWMWKAAPNFFDVVVYRGRAFSGGDTIPHNLGVKPEMIWYKNTYAVSNPTNMDWIVYFDAIGYNGSDYLNLNSDVAKGSGGGGSVEWAGEPDANNLYAVGKATWSNFRLNTVGDLYVAYLFATLPGVSKVGSYVGNGTSQTIDCGFSNGCKLFIVKRTSDTGDWFLWDSARGISSGNDPFIILNDIDAVDNTTDSVDPDSSGIIVNELSPTNINANNSIYVFYAIAN
tara:strand:+ start:388 stop:2454 length:2067 start_codon:yes stop_codon:yes gene_type:complete